MRIFIISEDGSLYAELMPHEVSRHYYICVRLALMVRRPAVDDIINVFDDIFNIIGSCRCNNITSRGNRFRISVIEVISAWVAPSYLF